MKKCMVVSMCVCLLGLTGCDWFAKTTFTPEQLKVLSDQVITLADQLTVYQAQVTSLADSMQTAGILDPNDAAKVAKLNMEIDKVKGQVKTVAEAIKTGTFDTNDDTLLAVLKIAQAANAATASFNPYSTYIGLALTAIIAILGLFAKKKTTEATVAKTALNEVVIANETFKNAAAPEVAKAFKDAQEIHQSESTTKEVAKITA